MNDGFPIRKIIWGLLIAVNCTHLGLSSAENGIFEARVLMHNIDLWIVAARERITND